MLRSAAYTAAILFCLGLCTELHAALRLAHQFDTYNSALPGNLVYKILCDKQGFIWLATNRGLVRFDGNDFETFDRSNGCPDDDLVDIFYFSEQDRIWPMSYNGKIFSMNTITRKPEIISIPQTISGALLYAFSIDDTIKILTTSQIVSLYHGHPAIAPYDRDIYRQYLYSNRLFPSHINTRLFTKRSWEDIKQKIHEGRMTGNQSRILKYGMLATGEKLYGQRNGQAFELINIRSFITDPEAFIVDAELAGNDLYIAVGGNNGGIYQGKDFLIQPAATVFSLISVRGHGTSVCKDQQGNIWYAIKNKGLFFIERSLANLPFLPLNLPDNNYSYIRATGDTGIFVTDQRSMFLEVNNITGIVQTRDTQYISRLPGSMKQNMALKDISHDGNMFFYSPLYALLKRRPGAATVQITLPLPSYSMKNADYSGDDILLSVSGNNLLYRYNMQTAHIEQIQLPGEISIIDDIFFRDKSFILLCAKNGVYITDSSFSGFRKLGAGAYKKALLHDNTFYFINDVELATYDARKDAAIVPVLNSRYLLPHFTIRDIDAGLHTIDMLTDKGYLIFSDSSLRQFKNPEIAFALQDIRTKDSIYQVTQPEINTGYQGYRNIRFTIHFLNPQNENFKKSYSVTRQGDHTDDWLDFTGNSFVHANLAPGAYHLKIRVALPGTGITRTMQYNMIIMPHFWQTDWFNILLIATLVAGAVTITYYLLRRRQRRRITRMQVEKQVEELENKVFLNQLNPHFLYNALNTLQNYLVQKDTHNGLLYLQRVAGLSRSIIDFHHTAAIIVGEEIQFLERFLFILQKRFGDKFHFEIKCDASLHALKIPPMLLQPLAENAIEHGLAGVKTGGLIFISFEKERNGLLVSIADNGNGNAADIFPLKEGHALSIINQRLNLSVNNRSLSNNFIIAEPNSPKGIIIKIKIPEQ